MTLPSKLVTVPIETLVPDPKNARSHNGRNLEAIQGSLKAFGQVENLVVQQGTNRVIGGHGRLEAMKAMGMTHAEVRMVDLTDAQASKLGLALNRTAELAGWDLGNLGQTIEELKNDNIDVSDIGFSDDEIGAIFPDAESISAEDVVEDDDIPDPPEDPITKPGDLWVLGDNRLLCGSSAIEDDVVRLMDGRVAVLMNTDPPYGVSVCGGSTDPKSPAYQSGGRIQNDNLSDEKLLEFLSSVFVLGIKHLRPGASWYVWFAGSKTRVFLDATDLLGGMRHMLIWVKHKFVFGRSDYHYKHEPVMYGWIPGAAHDWLGSRDQSSVFEYQKKVDMQKSHPTAKPVELFAVPLDNHTRVGDVVYEPFSGSGSQIIACQQMGRSCYAMEIEPKYCDVAVARWEKLTGLKAVKS